jgi:hypothetical protein
VEEKTTPATSLLQPDANSALYVALVLTIYVDLPETHCAGAFWINGSPAAP